MGGRTPPWGGADPPWQFRKNFQSDSVRCLNICNRPQEIHFCSRNSNLTFRLTANQVDGQNIRKLGWGCRSTVLELDTWNFACRPPLWISFDSYKKMGGRTPPLRGRWPLLTILEKFLILPCEVSKHMKSTPRNPFMQLKFEFDLLFDRKSSWPAKI